jgi:hypothetical protein
MNKKNQGIEVKLSVIALSAILVASLFVMGSSRFIPYAMAQNFTDQTGAAAGGAANMTGAAANQTGGAAGGAANQTGAAAGGAAGGAANRTGAAAAGGAAGGAANMTGAAAAGGAANQTGAMVMIPQAAMTSMMDDIETVRGAIDEGDTEAVDALDNVEMQLRTAAGLPPSPADTGAEEEEAGAEEEEAGAAEEGAAADEDDDAGADDDAE